LEVAHQRYVKSYRITGSSKTLPNPSNIGRRSSTTCKTIENIILVQGIVSLH